MLLSLRVPSPGTCFLDCGYANSTLAPACEERSWLCVTSQMKVKFIITQLPNPKKQNLNQGPTVNTKPYSHFIQTVRYECPFLSSFCTFICLWYPLWNHRSPCRMFPRADPKQKGDTKCQKSTISGPVQLAGNNRIFWHWGGLECKNNWPKSIISDPIYSDPKARPFGLSWITSCWVQHLL